MKTISASEANRHFSSLLRQVAAGESITILSRGKPVATLAPAGERASQREQAQRMLLARLQGRQPVGLRDWRRDDLYDAD